MRASSESRRALVGRDVDFSSDAAFTERACLESPASNEGRPRKPASPIVKFLMAIERVGPEHVPATLDDLAEAGFPSDLFGMLADLVAAGYEESDVVRALLEALGAMLLDRTVKARTSRYFARSLRRQFGNAAEQRELRDSIATMLRDSVGIPEQV